MQNPRFFLDLLVFVVGLVFTGFMLVFTVFAVSKTGKSDFMTYLPILVGVVMMGGGLLYGKYFTT